MTISGGKPLEWLRPLPTHDEDGNRLLGTHQGDYTALNVRNPQQGVHYYYARRDGSAVLRMRNQGWQVVRSDDPERWGADMSGDERVPELDGIRAFQDVLLMRTTEQNYRRLKAELAEQAKIQLYGSTDEYLDKGQRLEAQLQYRPQEGPLYYKRGQHGIQVEER